jgi:CPA2 family monovalent cation:H+ antiporter-2
MVLMRHLMDRGELGSYAGREMITLTLVEDLAVVVLTVILPGLSPSSHENFAHVGFRIAKSLLLLIPIAAAAWKSVPRLLARVEKTCNDEISLLLALTICLAIAALTEAVALSLALAVLFLGKTSFTHKLEEQTRSLRDAFVALFFATVGMLINPQSWITSWRTILLLVGMVLVGKFVIWTGVVRLFRYSTGTAIRVGIGLTQIGEFSHILAQVSLSAGLISQQIYNASLVTILANATLFRFVKPAATAKLKIPAPAQTTV